jgi:hypothetical protein
MSLSYLKDSVAAIKLYFIFNSFPCRLHFLAAIKLYFIFFLSLVLPFSLKKTTQQPTYSDEGVVSAKASVRPALVQEGSASARLRRCVCQGSDQATITEKPIPTKRFARIWCEILQGLGARGRPEIGENGFAVIQ